MLRSATLWRAFSVALWRRLDGDPGYEDVSALAALSPRSSCDLYMEILAEGCGDELDGLRREGSNRDAGGDGSESLSFLIDSLEVGAETF